MPLSAANVKIPTAQRLYPCTMTVLPSLTILTPISAILNLASLALWANKCPFSCSFFLKASKSRGSSWVCEEMNLVNMAQPAVSEMLLGTESISALEPVSMDERSSWIVSALEASQRAERDSIAAIGMDFVESSVRRRE